LPRHHKHFAEPDRRGNGRLRDQTVLVEQPRRHGYFASVEVSPGQEVEGVLQLDERAGAARDPDLADGQGMPGVVIPQLICYEAGGSQAS